MNGQNMILTTILVTMASMMRQTTTIQEKHVTEAISQKRHWKKSFLKVSSNAVTYMDTSRKENATQRFVDHEQQLIHFNIYLEGWHRAYKCKGLP